MNPAKFDKANDMAELTHLNEAMARAFVTFVRRDFADPDPPPFVVFWFYSHPPIRERVAFALTYRPWEVKAEAPVGRTRVEKSRF